ncbi:hypothetical protein [Rhodovibrio salinarum]|uniref:Glycosyl transferase family 8 n=1 Tax=Rhodovibrio salinarum TaxID=1087 RepID=A0A934QJ95_9PROT|nr:hypothetical protein [Rhodovibrio salinarum]MBK1697455.1 hypothetical protein [Rhodovibrio salinarum]
MNTVVVTAADQNFFSMLQTMVESVAARVDPDHVSIRVIDLGLRADQRAALSDKVESFIQVDWDIVWPFTPNLPEHKKAFTVSPFLPKYLPDAETIVWIDADAWVQTERAIPTLVAGAQAADLAIAPQIHPCYPDAVSRGKVRTFNVPLLRGRARRITSWGRTQLRRRYSRAVANAALFKPTYNAGVFAGRGDSPVWSVWEQAYRTARIRRPRDLSDQAPINYAIHTGQISVSPLPATFNWICDLRLPAWDPERAQLVTPAVPYEPIHIVHVLGQSKYAQHTIKSLDGSPAPVDVWGTPLAATAEPT